MTATRAQRVQVCYDALDEIVAETVKMLDDGMDPDAVAVIQARLFQAVSPARACTLAAFAVVRLAQLRREARP